MSVGEVSVKELFFEEVFFIYLTLMAPFWCLYCQFWIYEACNSIKKETLAQVFSCEFCEISKNTFFTEHLWATASTASITFAQTYRNFHHGQNYTIIIMNIPSTSIKPTNVSCFWLILLPIMTYLLLTCTLLLQHNSWFSTCSMLLILGISVDT